METKKRKATSNDLKYKEPKIENQPKVFFTIAAIAANGAEIINEYVKKIKSYINIKKCKKL